MEMVLLEESTILSGCVSNMSPLSLLPTGTRLRCFGRRAGGRISSLVPVLEPQLQEHLLLTHFETIPGEQNQQELGMGQEVKSWRQEDTSEITQSFQ